VLEARAGNVDAARRHRIEGDAVAYKVGHGGQRLHEAGLGRLGHGEPRPADAFLAAIDRGDGDHAAPFAASHVRQGAAGEADSRHGVLLVDLAPDLQVGVLDDLLAPASTAADVVDQDLHAAPFAVDNVDHAIRRLRVEEIG